MAREAHKAIGTYFYFFPTFAQARKVLWDGMDKTGFKFIDHFPKELVKNKNESEMRIELKFGSAIQFVGTDNFDAIRGTNPIGTVWSEFAFQNPAAWDVVRPILKENGGWALFNTTPNGKNHAKRLWDMATANPNWFTQKLTIADTGVLTAADIDEERRSGMTEEMIQQEYYCSFDVGMLGSYYGAEMEQARMEGRITPLPFRMDVGIDVYFDLGISDETAMWFGQTDAEFYNMVNYYENSNKTFHHYAQVIDDFVTYKKGKLGHIYVPHDANKRDWVTGKTALHAFEEKFGKEKVTRVEIGGLETGIQATRAVIPSVRFDSDTCAQGINCLENYSREFNQITKSFNPKPKHDWASHGCLLAGSKILTKTGERNIEQIKIGDLIKTPMGYKRVLNSGIVGQAHEIYEVEFSTGRKLAMTGNHKVFIQNGLEYADALRENQEVFCYSYFSWVVHQLLNLKALFLGFRKAHCITDQELVALKKSSIVKCIKNSMVISKRGLSFITKTIISSTTLQRILLPFLQKSTILTTVQTSIGKILIGTKRQEQKTPSDIPDLIKTRRGLKTFSPLLWRRPKSGTEVRMDENGILNTGKKFGRKDSGLISSVLIAKKLIKQLFTPEVNIVRVVVKVYSDPKKVYDLTIEKDHCYYAEGVLVSNSDSFRTFGVTYKSYQHKTIIGPSSRKDDDDYEKEYRAIIKEDYGDDL